MFYLLNPVFRCSCKGELVWNNKESNYRCSDCESFYDDNSVHNNFLLIRSLEEE